MMNISNTVINKYGNSQPAKSKSPIRREIESMYNGGEENTNNNFFTTQDPSEAINTLKRASVTRLKRGSNIIISGLGNTEPLKRLSKGELSLSFNRVMALSNK